MITHEVAQQSVAHDELVSLVERMLELRKRSPRTPQEQEMVKRAPGKAPGILRSSQRM